MPFSQFSLLDIEERANVLSHFIGVVIFLMFVPFLFYKIELKHPIFLGIGLGVFCIAGGATLLISSLYHLQLEVKKKAFFRKLDHISIYLLIGGSYTAFIALYFNEYQGWIFLMIQWTMILFGIIFKLFFTGKLELLSTAFYLILGWMVVFIYEPISANIDAQSLVWLAFGGLAYTVGVVFYVWNKLKFNHFIWHLFVLIGVYCHAIALYLGIG